MVVLQTTVVKGKDNGGRRVRMLVPSRGEASQRDRYASTADLKQASFERSCPCSTWINRSARWSQSKGQVNIVVKDNRLLYQSRVSWPVRDSGRSGRVRRATRNSKRCNSEGTIEQQQHSFKQDRNCSAVQQRITRQQGPQNHHGPQPQPQAQSKRWRIAQGRGQRKQASKDQTGECASCCCIEAVAWWAEWIEL